MDVQKCKKLFVEWWMLLIPFGIMLPLLRVSPMLYDGWAGPSYYAANGGIVNWIGYVFGTMRDWINGRVASNLVSGILESFASEIPLDVTAALILAGILYCTLRLFDVKNKVAVALLYTTMLVLMPYEARTYVVQIALWQYLAPILFVLIALLLLNGYTQNGKRGNLMWLYLLCMIACTWMENTSVAYGMVLVCYCLIHSLQTKKIDWPLWGTVPVSLASGLFMILSNGMMISRITIPGAEPFLSFSKARLMGQLSTLFRKLIYEGSMTYSCLGLVLFALSLCVVFRKDQTKLQLGLHIALCVENIAAIVAFFMLGLYTHEFQYTAPLEKTLGDQIAGNNRMLLLCVLLFGFWLVTNFLLLCKPSRNSLLVGLYGVILLAVIFPTNQKGTRMDAPAYVILIVLACGLLARFPASEQEKKTLVNVSRTALAIGFILAMDFQSQLCMHIGTVQAERERKIGYIREVQFLGMQSSDHVYTLPPFNERDILTEGVTPLGSFHYPQFLAHEGLYSNTKIIFTTNASLEVNEVVQTQAGMSVTFQNHLAGNFVYSYVVSFMRGETYQEVERLEGQHDCNYFAKNSQGSGNYELTITAVEPETGAISVQNVKWFA